MGKEKTAARQPKKPSGKKPAGGRGEGARRKSGKASGAPAGGELKKQPSLKRMDSDLDFEQDDMQPVEVRRVPEDQVQGLTPEQMAEVFTKTITATNPNAPRQVTRFNYKEGAFKGDDAIDHLMVHFHMESTLIHVDSEEARRDRGESLSYDEAAELPGGERKSPDQGEDAEGAEAAAQGGDAGGEAAGGGGDAAAADEPAEKRPATKSSGTDATAGPAGGKALRNQFNFSERASQTFNNPMRDRAVATEPAPTRAYCGSVTQWEIFDAYLKELLEQRAAKADKAAANNARHGKDDQEDANAHRVVVKDGLSPDQKILQLPSLLAAVKVMERTVNQNSQDDTFHDYKYFEDDADAVREDGKGDFLQLWRFGYREARRMAVTAVVWNPEFTDLFAVSYGSYDFTRQGPGMVCCYSLKNTAHPEYVFHTTSGVMSLDFHPQHSALLAAGLYDGTVCVFDVRSEDDKPIYVSNDPAVKHTDPVWQVRWQEAGAGGAISFCSVSSDGRVTNWVMNKNELVNEEVVELKLLGDGGAGEGGAAAAAGGAGAGAVDDDGLLGLAGGSCFDFNPKNPDLFVVGTEEGSVTSYNKTYNSQHVASFKGHHMSVYTVRWSPFHERVFLTCSADWTVKLWEQDTTEPVMTFDLSNAVGDVAWSPYSSTVFACVTNDGKLRVYDLAVNKHEPIGETRVAKKTKLTHVCFNPREPVVLVGDDTGAVVSLKLSPNLRKMSARDVTDIDHAKERERLDRLLVIEEQPNERIRVRRQI